MQFIKQHTQSDCGVACVAMLAGVSYEKANKALFPKTSPRITSSGKLAKALRTLGRKPLVDRMISLKRIDFNDLRHDALIGVVMDGSCKHWVVWDANKRRILDPYTDYEHEIRVV